MKSKYIAWVGAAVPAAAGAMPHLLISPATPLCAEFFDLALILGLSATIFLAVYIASPERAESSAWPKALLWTVVSVYALLFAALALRNRQNLGLNALDFGYFDNMVWNTLHGRFLYSTLKWACFLGEHFSPIMLLYVPLYAVRESPAWLLLTQTAALAAAAVVIYRIAEEETGRGLLAVSLAVSYLMFPFVQKSNVTDFHMDSLQPLLIALSYYWLRKRRYGVFSAAYLLLLLSKEDAGLYGICIGLCEIFVRGRRKAGAVVAVAGALWIPLTIFLVMPLFSAGEYVFYDRYAYLRGTAGEIAGALLDPERLRGPAFLLAALSTLPFAEPRALVVFLPAALPLLLSGYWYTYRFDLYYGLQVSTLVWIAACVGAGRLVRQCLQPARLSAAFSAYLLAAGILLSHFLGHSPLARGVGLESLRRDPRSSLVRELMRKVPANASVCAQMRLMPFFAHRKEVFLFGGLDNRPFTGEDSAPDYVALDVNGIFEPLIPAAKYRRDVVRLLAEGDYGALCHVDGFLLLKRGAPAEQNDDAYRSAFVDMQAERLPCEDGYNVEDFAALNRVARLAPGGKAGYVMISSLLALPAGEYEAVFYVRSDTGSGSLGRAEVAGPGIETSQSIEARPHVSGYYPVTLAFRLDANAPAHFRAYSNGVADFRIDRVELKSRVLSLERAFESIGRTD